MAVKRLTNFRIQWFDGNQVLANNYRLFFYAATSSTKQNTYNSSTGANANPNPIFLNALGESAVEIWLTVGLTYKVVLAPPGSDDPPASPVWTEDVVAGINDASVSIDQWPASGILPTFVSATQFTMPGDQTSAFHINRHLKFTTNAGTVYGRITASAFAALTTVTMQMDGIQVLDVGLSAVFLSILTNNVLSVPSRIGTAAGTDTYTVATGASTLNIGDEYKIKIVNANTSTTPTLNIDSLGAKTIVNTSGGAMLPGQLNGEHTFRWNGTNMVVLNAVALPFPRSLLAGLTMSPAGGSATMPIAAGQCADSTNAELMLLAAINKTTAAWVVGTGNGGLDTGAIANATWYHFYVITRVDTGVVDVVFSLNAVSPTLPANYTLFRRIGAGFTNGAAQWVKFLQVGDDFTWDVLVQDVAATNPGVAAVVRTLTVPTGLVVQAKIVYSDQNNTTNHYALVTALSQTDTTPSATAYTTNVNFGALQGRDISLTIATNTSAQIRTRQSASGAADPVTINTIGWIDRRGRDA